MPKKRSRLEQRKWLKSEAKRQCIPLSLLKQRLKIDGDRKAKEGQEGEDGARTTEVGRDRVQEESGEDDATTINCSGGSSQVYEGVTSLHERSSGQERLSNVNIILGEGENKRGSPRGGGREEGGSSHEEGCEGVREGGGLPPEGGLKGGREGQSSHDRGCERGRSSRIGECYGGGSSRKGFCEGGLEGGSSRECLPKGGREGDHRARREDASEGDHRASAAYAKEDAMEGDHCSVAACATEDASADHRARANALDHRRREDYRARANAKENAREGDHRAWAAMEGDHRALEACATEDARADHRARANALDHRRREDHRARANAKENAREGDHRASAAYPKADAMVGDHRAMGACATDDAREDHRATANANNMMEDHCARKVDMRENDRITTKVDLRETEDHQEGGSRVRVRRVREGQRSLGLFSSNYDGRKNSTWKIWSLPCRRCHEILPCSLDVRTMDCY